MRAPDPLSPETARAWLATRTTCTSPDDLDHAVRLKGDRTVSVVLPARDEERTIGSLVGGLVRFLQLDCRLVDELVVLDDASRDRTAQVAAEAGARVVSGPAVHPEVSRGGKGCAMWKALIATRGELVVFLDADVPEFPAHWVASLLLPLLREPAVGLVKAAYDRPLEVDGVAHPGSGGRVTRLVAIPSLGALVPELTVFAQPLAGETAARRSLLESLPFMTGYGVELGLLLDAHARLGLPGLAQVDLGVRSHRHQSDEALGEMAAAVLQVALDRAGRPLAAEPRHSRVDRDDRGRLRFRSSALELRALPPVESLPAG